MRRLGDLARVASLLAIFAMLLAACGSTGGTGGTTSGSSSNTSSSTQNAKKVALVTDIGGVNDNGFNHLSYTGYSKAKAQYGFTEKVIQTQSQNDYVTNLTLAAQSSDLVIAVGFLMNNAIDQVAKQFPNKKFAIVDGCATAAGASNCETLPNVAPLSFKEQEAGCLVGAIAGQMEVDGKDKISKLLGKNTVGVVGGLSIPPVDRYIAGFKYCIKKVDPSVNVLVNYSQDFTNPAKCKDAALSQINQHQADIIFQVAGGCGVGALDAADQKGVFGIGVDADQGYLHASVLTSAMKRVDTAVYDTIKDFEDGKFTNNPPKFDLAHDGVGYAPISKDVPADAKQKAEDFANQIKSGALVPPENIQ
ncbi:BMP family ABC transporter substrate-binding protein [Ktedonosporobacter rubrisoli]|uniref:BMP family ABC transporter substrate-binding protein n=1 Tax=Ktedonosporobacter rubrisoli TaxID=2509675 RepID=A0A4V0YZP8_KTERU|nr:BMP family ABC transporter substrate-binding protein [Ktedonosporobacter rubrisoli]QBD80471.1 BMP family ABC transporter substrate-binding protein [Ktedonosporobacter rubrisoli]